jgi:acyl carrier protein
VTIWTPTASTLVELVMALEEEFDISVPEEELEGVETVGQAYDLVADKL